MDNIMTPNPQDIVLVNKSTRAKFGTGNARAPVNMVGYVITTWTSFMGTVKLQMIDELGDEYFTTAACVEVTSRSEENEEVFANALETWRDRTFVPIICYTTPSAKLGLPIHSVTKQTVMINNMRDRNTAIWLAKRNCHPDDWRNIMKSMMTPQAFSLRVPLWFAKKHRFIG